MAVQIKRPVLMVGVGLTLAAGVLDMVSHALEGWGGWWTMGTVATSVGIIWWLRQARPVPVTPRAMPTTVDRAQVEQAIAQVKARLHQASQEWEQFSPAAPRFAQERYHRRRADLTKLQSQLEGLQPELDRQTLMLAVAGAAATGKTNLVQQLQSGAIATQLATPLTVRDLPSLFMAAKTDTTQDTLRTQALTADLTLFLVTGDLTDSEFQAIAQLQAARQPLILVLNKQDQYSPGDRIQIVERLKTHLNTIAAELTHSPQIPASALLPVSCPLPAQVVAIATRPHPTIVRQIQADGTAQETVDYPIPQTAELDQALTQVEKLARPLIWATVWRKCLLLDQAIQQGINQARRDRALPLIENCQWIAAASAFANPVPALDLLASTAITAQMVMDLSKIYQQPLSWRQAKTIAGTLATLLVKLGLVELSTQLVGTLLKSNTLTYMAGGALQAVSAAYLTRVAGLSLVAYFQDLPDAAVVKTPIHKETLQQKVQTVFQTQRQPVVLEAIAQTVADKLAIEHPQPTP